MRADLQNYLIAKSQGLVGTQRRKMQSPSKKIGD